jgi:hypothetical protein
MRGAAIALALLLAGCAADRGAPPCGPGLERWTLTEIYLGLNRPDGGIVTDAQFQDFVAREVVPRLPEGFTVVPAEGAWRSTQTGATIREPSRILRRLRKEGREPEVAINEVIAAYKTSFAQEAVLRVDSDVCAAF